MDKPLEFILVPKCPLFGDSTVHIKYAAQITVEAGLLELHEDVKFCTISVVFSGGYFHEDSFSEALYEFCE